MEGKTCCVTGHRDLPQKEINHVKAALRREIDCAVADLGGVLLQAVHDKLDVGAVQL